MIKEASSAGTSLEILGAGTKRDVGRPMQASAALSTSRLFGITLYEPNELVIAAKAGTPLSLIQDTLTNHRQILAFEPLDLSPALGIEERGSIGSLFATNLSGSRRLVAGAARDHFIGVRAINGNGEIFKSGGRVMKNVTGYDLCKGLSGSWGTLALMTEVTMKVLPAPEETNTILLQGPPDAIAIEALCSTLSSPYGVSGAVHFQAGFAQSFSDTFLKTSSGALSAIRIENFRESVSYRLEKLKTILGHYGNLEILDNSRSLAFWKEMQQLKFLQGSGNTVWRLSTAPQNGVRLFEAIRTHHPKARAVFDWSGGLIWLVMPTANDSGSFEIHRAVAEFGGHATLIRAEAPLRAAADVFQPLEAGMQQLTKRIKDAFDPAGILNPGRMYAGL